MFREHVNEAVRDHIVRETCGLGVQENPETQLTPSEDRRVSGFSLASLLRSRRSA
jgi:hypothetical protein